MSTNGTVITKGIPSIDDPMRKGFFTKTHGFYSQGKRDAAALLETGRGNHIKKKFEKNSKQCIAYLTGARHYNVKKGSPFSVSQRTEGSNTYVYICFTADLEGICEGS